MGRLFLPAICTQKPLGAFLLQPRRSRDCGEQERPRAAALRGPCTSARSPLRNRPGFQPGHGAHVPSVPGGWALPGAAQPSPAERGALRGALGPRSHGHGTLQLPAFAGQLVHTRACQGAQKGFFPVVFSWRKAAAGDAQRCRCARAVPLRSRVSELPAPLGSGSVPCRGHRRASAGPALVTPAALARPSPGVLGALWFPLVPFGSRPLQRGRRGHGNAALLPLSPSPGEVLQTKPPETHNCKSSTETRSLDFTFRKN